MRLMPFNVWTRWIKRRVPTSLWGRSLLIIVLPVLIMQAAVTWAFFDAHWQAVTARLSEGLAGDVAWAAESYRDDPSPQNLALISERAERSMQLSIAFQPEASLPQEERRGALGLVDRTLEKALASRLDQPFWFDTTRYPAYVDIRVQEASGVLRVIAPRERAVATQAHIFVLWLMIATILLLGVAVLFIRNQVRAIERLASAAEAFGRGESVPRFKPHGAREVRAAATAFLDMRARIQRHIDQRTALLASVSHDLRTPLTRLRLELALAPPFKRAEAMKGDLDEMEHMIDEYLAFARGEAGEAMQTISVPELLRRGRRSLRRRGRGRDARRSQHAGPPPGLPPGDQQPGRQRRLPRRKGTAVGPPPALRRTGDRGRGRRPRHSGRHARRSLPPLLAPGRLAQSEPQGGGPGPGRGAGRGARPRRRHHSRPQRPGRAEGVDPAAGGSSRRLDL